MSEKGPFGRDHLGRRHFLDNASFHRTDPSTSDTDEFKDRSDKSPILLLERFCKQKGYESPKYESKSSSSHYKVTVFVNGQSSSASSKKNLLEAKESAYRKLLEKFKEDSQVKAIAISNAETDSSQDSVVIINEVQAKTEAESQHKNNESIDDLLKDIPHPSHGNSTKSLDDLFEGTDGLIDDNPDSCLTNKKSSSDIFGEDCNILIASRYKGSPGSKKTTKDKSLINLSKSIKLSSPGKKAATALYQQDDDSPSASQLSRGSSTLSRKDKVAMPIFGNEPITKIKRSNSSFKKGMFDGLHDDKSRVDASGAKFKFNFDNGKKEDKYFKKSSLKGTSKSSHEVKANITKLDKSSFPKEKETCEAKAFKPRDVVRDESKRKGSSSKLEGSRSSQEGTSKGVKRKLKDSEEKPKGEQDHASKRNPFRIDKGIEKSKNDNDSSEEESKSNAKFSFDCKDKNDFKKSKESLKSKSSNKKTAETKTVKTLFEFNMFSHAGPVAKKETEGDSSPLVTPSSSTQKASQSLRVSNLCDFPGQDNFIRSLKKRPRDRRSLQSISKMSQLSQSMSQGSSQTESSTTRSSKTSYEYDPDYSFKKPRKKQVNKSSRGSQPKIDKIVKDKAKQKDEELALTIDELLSLPEKPDDDGKSLDELLDDLDVQIAEQKEKHRLQIRKLDEDAVIQQRRKLDREARYAANAINRNRLATELTQPVLKTMFGNILGFLEDIKAGLIESSRHKAYYKSLKTRQALLYTMITHPFTDQQVDWVYKEFADIWLRTKQEHADNNEYIWKVLMPEGFIRLYSDFFQVPMKEAEQRIKETPFDDSDESSDSSSENDD